MAVTSTCNKINVPKKLVNNIYYMLLINIKMIKDLLQFSSIVFNFIINDKMKLAVICLHQIYISFNIFFLLLYYTAIYYKYALHIT